ncbi:MAG TPA: pantoate--beta-alanine ligase [Gammaproteobacteria bacterium]|nr:pantoate--beta-alanine ligase [Gammaproteobacteria bacterium]
MNTLTTIKAWRETRASLNGKRIGFVPTMGNLHEGHLALCARSQQENEVTVASIFVNPTQFNQTQDFQSYPRTLDEDIEKLRAAGVNYVFAPNATEIYPDHFTVQVSETQLSSGLEGEHRPGHFTGMLTVVMKLLNIIQATRAYFGEKDYQQFLLVKKMVESLFMTVEVVAHQTVRAEDGLALSSRNSRLSKNARLRAASFSRLLQSSQSFEEIRSELLSQGFKVEYLEERWGRRLGAVVLEGVRLIDNVEV